MRSAFTQKVMGFVYKILSVHQVLPAEVSGQLPARVEAQSNKPKSTTSAKVPNTMR